MLFKKNRTENRFLIVGLGNPGKTYQLSRHNIGFQAIEYLSNVYNIRISRSRFSSLTGEGRIGDAGVTLIKPMTYMNLSGQAVEAAAKYYNIPVERIIVLCDDVSLDVGVIRIREQGSSGGQKGLLSIEEMLDSQHFKRIRIGIGDPKGVELKDYVLSSPTSLERKKIEERFEDVSKAVEMIVLGDLAGAQSRYNGTGDRT